jgi:hypothetical protein
MAPSGTTLGFLPAEDQCLPLNRGRVCFVYLIIAVLVGGSLYDLARDSEHWPFSQYGMYSEVQRDPSLSVMRLFGVTRGKSQEIPMLRFDYVQPLDQSRLRWAFEDMNYRPNREQRMRTALSDCLVRYELLRQAGRHQGPPLEGIRLYRVYWQLDPWARNADQPNRKELLFEVSARTSVEP